MAKKVVGSVAGASKNIVKIICAVKSKKNDKAVAFATQVATVDTANEVIKKMGRV